MAPGCAVLGVACSGAVGGGLFGSPISDDSSHQREGGTPAGNRDPLSDGSTSNEDAGTVDLDAGLAGHDGGQSDAGSDAPALAFRCETPDAGAPLTCLGPTTCCATQVNQVLIVTTTYSCVAPAQCAAADQAILRCHNETDCAGQFCCGDFDGTQYHRVACAQTCTRAPDGGTLNDHVRFCNPNLGGTDCEPGQTCTESSILRGYFRCG